MLIKCRGNSACLCLESSFIEEALLQFIVSVCHDRNGGT